MPVIDKYDGDTSPIVLLPVVHYVTAREAARDLWKQIYDLDNSIGLSVQLIQPTDSLESRWEVEWKAGPIGWTKIYVDQSGGVSEYTTTATRFSVVFEDSLLLF